MPPVFAFIASIPLLPRARIPDIIIEENFLPNDKHLASFGNPIFVVIDRRNKFDMY
jgi:hypothetical protein